MTVIVQQTLVDVQADAIKGLETRLAETVIAFVLIQAIRVLRAHRLTVLALIFIYNTGIQS